MVCTLRIDYFHSLRVGGWRLEVLSPATSQFTGLFDQVNSEFLHFFSMDAKSNSKAFNMPSP